MKVKYFFNVLFIWFSLFVVVHSQVLPTEEQKSEWKKFKKQDFVEWSISWDNKTGSPGFLYGPGISKYKGDAKTIAKNFIEEIIGLFLKTEAASNFEISKTKTVNGISHVRFQQNYNGIPVYGAQYIVHLNKDNEVYLANGKFFRDISINTTAKIKTDDVIKILEKEIQGSIKDLEINTREIIYPKEDQFILAYEVTLRDNRFFNRTYVIDANKGNVIDRVNNICDATGTGNVYLKHPSLTPSITAVSLTNLDGSGYIKGTYADVSTDIGYWFPQQPPTPSRAYSTSFNFQYTSTDFRFDEANAYYHISQFRDWLNTNYLSGEVPQLQVYTGIKDEAEVNNAYFNPPNTLGFGFGSGTGYHDFAREDKIIYHEYTHANAYELVELQNGYNQSGAISEGTADYFPASYTNRTLAGEYSLYGFTPRSSYPGKQRDVGSPLIDSYSRYTNNQDPVWLQAALYYGHDVFGEPHIGGEYFSSILWDIRNAIGQSVTNDLSFQTLSLLTTTATFLDFRQAMVAIDQIEYNGSHISTIETKFNNKGIIAPLNANITGPAYLQKSQSGTYKSNPTGGVGTRTFYWYLRTPPNTTWNLAVTTQDFTTTMGMQDFELKVEVHAGSETVYDTYYVQYDDGSLPKKMLENIKPMKDFALQQNYPNPFNPTTVISYQLPEDGFVDLRVYDVLGKEVATLVNEYKSAGYYTVSFDASKLTSGVYISTIDVNGFVQSKKMLFMK